MPQPPTPAQPADSQNKDEAKSGGERTSAGSNYGHWRPAAPDEGNGDSAPGAVPPPEPASGVTPSTAPSGIGSTPHK